MRINELWKLHRWFPVFVAMPRMLDDLEGDRESGLLAYDVKLGIRNHEVVQYRRSFEDLREYALDPDERHVPAMTRFAGKGGDVGIWHETFLVRAGEYETVYNNMPAIGLGHAGELNPVAARRKTAAGRLGLTEGGDMSYDEEGVEREPVEITPP
jgi:hypothetical protein